MMEHPEWSWSVREAGGRVVIAHKDASYRIELDAAGDTFWLAGEGKADRVVQEAELRPEVHERLSEAPPAVDGARAKLLGSEKSLRKAIRRGPWLITEGAEGPEWLGFRHERWSFCMVAGGASNGWWLSVDPSKVGYLYLSDFEEYLANGRWFRR